MAPATTETRTLKVREGLSRTIMLGNASVAALEAWLTGLTLSDNARAALGAALPVQARCDLLVTQQRERQRQAEQLEEQLRRLQRYLNKLGGKEEAAAGAGAGELVGRILDLETQLAASREQQTVFSRDQQACAEAVAEKLSPLAPPGAR